MLYEPPLESLDWKIFSPLHSQVLAELGSCMPYLVNSSNWHSGVQFEYGNNDADISQFLDTVINNSEDVEDDVHLHVGVSRGGEVANVYFLKYAL